MLGIATAMKEGNLEPLFAALSPDVVWNASAPPHFFRFGGVHRGVAGVREYSDWLWLKNVRHHFASRALVAQQGEFLRASFRAVAALEADLGLARHLSQTARHCWAERGDSIRFT